MAHPGSASFTDFRPANLTSLTGLTASPPNPQFFNLHDSSGQDLFLAEGLALLKGTCQWILSLDLSRIYSAPGAHLGGFLFKSQGAFPA